MIKIRPNIIHPSSAYGLTRKQLRYFKPLKKTPRVGDVVIGEICQIGEHSSLENKSARIHMIDNGSKSIFVFGNRYAPDYYEAIVPKRYTDEVDLIARSGLIGIVQTKNTLKKDPTRVKILGYVCDDAGTPINTLQYPALKPRNKVKKSPRAKLILVCGTAMNSGKSVAAAACCWALKSMNYEVRASKATGTASLKDILSMNDAGASYYSDFTFLGYPSTYLLDKTHLLSIFNKLDLKYANNPNNFWVVEFADGISQRETAFLLQSDDVRKRIHRLIFCANDAFGAIGGLQILKEKFDLVPDALSGVCSSSPLHIKELSGFTSVPVFNSFNREIQSMENILL